MKIDKFVLLAMLDVVISFINDSDPDNFPFDSVNRLLTIIESYIDDSEFF